MREGKQRTAHSAQRTALLRHRPVISPGGSLPRWLCAVCCVLCASLTPAWGQVERPEDPRTALILLLLLPVALVSFAALELVLWVLAPGPLTATCQAIVRGRGRCLLTGCVTVVAVMALVSVLSPHPGIRATIAALLLGLVLLGGLTGVTAVAALLGQSALEMAGGTGSRALKVAGGSVLLVLAGLFPVIGWVLFIYFVLVGLGGAVLALGRSWKREK
jgi:hypothetical protein